MKHKFSLLALLFFVFTTQSCKIKRNKEITGVVINRATKKPLNMVKVILKDGIATSNGWLDGDTGPLNIDSTYTNADGRFQVEIRTKKEGGYITYQKEGYESYTISKTIQGVNFPEKTQEITLEMAGIAYFNAVFKKTSATPKDNDYLKVSILKYPNNLYPNYQLTDSEFKGKGPFVYWKSDPEGVSAIGDSYLRFQLEVSGSSSFTKIDSVFIPTSLTPFRDTIYY